MKNLIRPVKSFLRHKNIKFEPWNDKNHLKFEFDGDNSWFHGFIYIDEETRLILVKTVSPTKVPKNKRLKIVDLITRINSQIPLGNFELSLKKGLICFRTSLMLGNSSFREELMQHLLFANWFIADKYFPAFNMVLFGNIQPQKAIELSLNEPPYDPDEQDGEGTKTAETLKPINRFKGLFGESLN